MLDILRLRLCANCDQAYSAAADNQRYCSLKCSESASRKRRRLRDTEKRLSASKTADEKLTTTVQRIQEEPELTPLDDESVLRRILGIDG